MRPNSPDQLPAVALDATSERVVEGIGVAPGIAIGPALVFTSPTFHAASERVEAERADEEVARFHKATARAERELGKITSLANARWKFPSFPPTSTARATRTACWPPVPVWSKKIPRP